MAPIKMSKEAFDEFKRKEAAELAARKKQASGSTNTDQKVKTYYPTKEGETARHLERQETNRRLREEAGVTPASGGAQKVKTYYDAPQDKSHGLLSTAKKVGRGAVAVGKKALDIVDKKSAGYLEDSEKAEHKTKRVLGEIDENFEKAGRPKKGIWTDPEADFKHKGYGEYKPTYKGKIGSDTYIQAYKHPFKEKNIEKDDFEDIENKKGGKINKKGGKISFGEDKEHKTISHNIEHEQYRSEENPKPYNQSPRVATRPFGGQLPKIGNFGSGPLPTMRGVSTRSSNLLPTIGDFGGGPLPRIGGPQNISRSPPPKIHSPGGSHKPNKLLMNDLPRISMFETNIGGGFGLNNNLPPKKKSGNLMKDIKSLNVKSSGY